MNEVRELNEEFDSILNEFSYITSHYKHVGVVSYEYNMYFKRVQTCVENIQSSAFTKKLNASKYIKNLDFSRLLNNYSKKLIGLNEKLNEIKERYEVLEKAKDPILNPGGTVSELLGNIVICYKGLVRELKELSKDNESEHSKLILLSKKDYNIITSFHFKSINIHKNDVAFKKFYNDLEFQLDCSYKEFYNLFSKQTVFKKVDWKGNANELVYLFHLLFDLEILDRKGSLFPHQQLKACFNFKSDNSSKLLSAIIKNDKKPKSHIFFREIVNSLNQ